MQTYRNRQERSQDAARSRASRTGHQEAQGVCCNVLPLSRSDLRHNVGEQVSCHDILHRQRATAHLPDLDAVPAAAIGAALEFNTHVERSGVPEGAPREAPGADG